MTSQKSGKGSPSKQAYHGAGAPSPPPYWGSPIMAGHVPHAQMWGPTQGMMPPYGVPYPGVYPPGVVYAHPGVPLVAAPASTPQPSKISDDIDRSLTNKVKRLETISTQLVDDVTEEDDKGSSWSQEQSYDASCDKGDPKATDERQLKREKRKQANRESARRSRMRKQAEVEELMERYETLKMENANLNSEINRLIEESEKLRVENAALMEKLDSDEAIRPEEMGDVNYEPSIDQQNHMNSEFMANDSTSYNGDDENESDALQNSDSVTNLLTFEPREDVATT